MTHDKVTQESIRIESTILWVLLMVVLLIPWILMYP